MLLSAREERERESKRHKLRRQERVHITLLVFDVATGKRENEAVKEAEARETFILIF